MGQTLILTEAESIARQLALIPNFPRYEETILCVAEALVEWCHGAILEDGVYSAAAQADWVVKQAILRMKKSWEGVPVLRQIFQEKFEPARAEEPKATWQPISYESAVNRGLMAPDCEACHGRLYLGEAPSLRYCTTCAAGRQNARWLGEVALARRNHPDPKPTTPAQQGMSEREAEAMFLDWQERRAEALASARAVLADTNSTTEEKTAALHILSLYEDGGKRSRKRQKAEASRLSDVFRDWRIN